MSQTINNTPESIEAAADAIAYALKRIAQDENLRAHMGPFTKGFSRLVKAQALLTGRTEKEITDEVDETPLRYKSNYSKVTEIRDIVDDLCDGAPDANGTAKLANEIASICRS